MGAYFGTTEITNFDCLVPVNEVDITQVFFAANEIFTVWAEYDGTLPATYSANGDYLADYRIYGESGKVGDRTVNLFDKDNTVGIISNHYINSSGAVVYSINYYLSAPLPVAEGDIYTWTRYAASLSTADGIGFFDENDSIIGAAIPSGGASVTFTIPVGCDHIRASVHKGSVGILMLTESSTVPASYVPYGYELPMTVFNGYQTYDDTLPATFTANGAALGDYRVYGAAGGVGDDSGTAYGYVVPMSVSDGTASTTTPIYIGSNPLGEDEYVDYGVGKIWRFNKVSITEIVKEPLYGQETITVQSPDNSSFTVESGSTQTYYESITIYPKIDGYIRFKCRINVEKFSNYGRLLVGIRNSQNSFILTREVTNLGDTDITFEMAEIPTNSYISIMATYASPATFAPYKYTITGAEISIGIMQDPPVPLPVLPTVDGTNIVDYAGQSVAPSGFYGKYINSPIIPIYVGSSPLNANGGYADYVDYQSQKIKRRIKTRIFNGSETFIPISQYPGVYTLPVSDHINNDGLIAYSSNYFTWWQWISNGAQYGSAPDKSLFGFINFGLYVKDVDYLTSADFKNHVKELYDAGTPLTVTYVTREYYDTDPPIPLPALSTYDGTTIVDYAGQSTTPTEFYAKYRKQNF